MKSGFRKTHADQAMNSHNEAEELDYYANCLRRDKQYVSLLEHYVKNQKSMDCAQFWFRVIFFVIVCGTFGAIVVLGGLTIWNISQKENISWQDIGAALAGLGSILSVIIVLPSKIAEHLFPAGGNENSMEFIKSMQEYDLSRNSSSSNELKDMEDIIIQMPEAQANIASDTKK